MSFELVGALFDSLGTELAKSLGKQATGKWKQFGWQRAAEEYCKKMLNLYNSVRVLGKPEPMTLEGLGLLPSSTW